MALLHVETRGHKRYTYGEYCGSKEAYVCNQVLGQERSKASSHVHLHDFHSKHVGGPDLGIITHVRRLQLLFRFCENKVDQRQQITVG